MTIHSIFASTATVVFALINTYSYLRFLKRIDCLFPFRGGVKCLMAIISLGEASYFLLLRTDFLHPALSLLFASLIGISFLLFCTALLYDLLYFPCVKIPHKPSRRRFIKRALDATLLMLALSSMLKGFFNASRPAIVREVEVKINHLKAELSVVQITDVHIGKTLGKAFLDDLVQKINTLDADIVVITGDLIDMPANEIGDRLDPLRAIKSRLGCFFVPGNHEYFYGADRIMEHIQRLGVTILANRSLLLDDTVNLAGVTDLMGRRMDFLPPDLTAALRQTKNGLPTVLLAHQPKVVRDMKDAPVDLILCGHTHGGQIFPFGLLVLLDQPYLSGLYQHSPRTQVFVSNGAGYWGPPVRLLAPAEIVRLRLRPEDAGAAHAIRSA